MQNPLESCIEGQLFWLEQSGILSKYSFRKSEDMNTVVHGMGTSRFAASVSLSLYIYLTVEEKAVKACTRSSAGKL